MRDLKRQRKQHVVAAKMNFLGGDILGKERYHNSILSAIQNCSNNAQEYELKDKRFGLIDVGISKDGNMIYGRLYRYKTEDIPKKDENNRISFMQITDKVNWSNFIFSKLSEILIFEERVG